MKKRLSIILILLLLFVAPVVSAANQEQQRIQDPETHTVDGEVAVTRQRLQDATDNLNRVVTRVNNPEVGEQIRTMAENHIRVQERVTNAFSRIDARGRVMRFIFGPDYKNAGEVRSQIAQIQNDIRDLEALKDDLTSTTDQREVQEAIDNLESEAEALQTDLDQKLEGFSLFGWLNRLLSRYSG
ncbi:MAG: hypothetical protein P8Y17_01375 [Patescibacteria group bacterium]